MNRQGFTFIELLTVFAIIAILAAILFPVFAKAQEKGRQTSCLQNLHNLGAALRMYAHEHYGSFPPVANDLRPLLRKHLPDPAALICPTLRHLKPIDFPPPTPEQLLAGKRQYDYVFRSGLYDDDNPQVIVVADRLADLHNTGANHLWVDGHAKWLSDYEQPDRRPNAEALEQIRRMGWDVMNDLRHQASGKVRLWEAEPPPVVEEGSS